MGIAKKPVVSFKSSLLNILAQLDDMMSEKMPTILRIEKIKFW